MSFYRPLHEGWTVSAAGRRPVPAHVPGCVHLDLLANELIPDPYLHDNETRLGWIGRTDWVYETTFDWADGTDFADLECDGLDTVATIVLNGREVARTANMHRRYRFPVRHLLRPGANHLSITFDSVYRYTEKLREELGPRPAAYDEPFNFVRKMACNFGWDWGPTLVTAGIWQPIGLREWSVARIAEVRPFTTAEGVVSAHITLLRGADVPLVVAAAVGESGARVPVAPGQNEVVVTFRVSGARLWWPRGYGDQPLYDLEVSLLDETGRLLESETRRIGFRTIELDTTPDEHGTPFTLVVNGKPVFARGVNWIPDDCFPARITRERLRHRLRQACEANVNFVRVWGGGRYESDDFYDLADEMGLLVAQDFLFACAAYPEEEPLASEVEAEARDNVARLASHPSLAMWTGNNECVWGHEDWGWQGSLNGKTWGAGYYFGMLPRVVSEVDPTRPYWPGSPYSGTTDRHPNHPAHGTTHIWDVWNTHDYTHYRSYAPRFVAEFGFQAPPAWATLAKGEHQKAIGGAEKLERALFRFPPPRDRDDWHYYTQLNQARAISLAVEHFRSLMPVCMGAVVWQLNDCWPVTSWSAIDGEGRRKPLWYALRESFADRLLTIQPGPSNAPNAGQPLKLVAVNDSTDPWHSTVTVSRMALDGRLLGKAMLSFEVAARSTVALRLPPDVSNPDSPSSELVLAQAEEMRAFWFFAEDRDIAYPRADWDAGVRYGSGEVEVTVRARTILRDLTLFPDRLDPAAEVDRALVTLLPGESVTFTVRTEQTLNANELTSPPVLRCVNDRD